jgi:hypothetical protein
LIIYRPDRLNAGGATFDVYLDGNEVGGLKNAGFLVVRTVPGSHTVEIQHLGITVNRSKVRQSVFVKQGERAFLRFEPSVTHITVFPASPVVHSQYSFMQVTEDRALEELREFRRSD